jgi:hypothetical protein
MADDRTGQSEGTRRWAWRAVEMRMAAYMLAGMDDPQ